MKINKMINEQPHKKNHERVTLTKNISNLIEVLTRHHEKHNNNEKHLVWGTALLAIATFLLVVFEFAHMYKQAVFEEEKIKFEKDKANFEVLNRTIDICDDFDNWFNGYQDANSNPRLQSLKYWLSCDTLIWKLDDKSGTNELSKNKYTHRFFNFFERVKMCSKSNSINKKYFSNNYKTLFDKLKDTEYPMVDSLIVRERVKQKDTTVWDGYKYCRDSIIYL